MSHPVQTPASAAPTSADNAPEAVHWADPARATAFARWLGELTPRYGLAGTTVRAASADASFRRYLRVQGAQGTLIIMDAPPDKEDCRPFEQVAKLMAQAGLRVPQLLEWDRAQGFVLLSDLGPQTMLQGMDHDKSAANLGLYLKAIDALIHWQLASRPGVLPPYDEVLLRRELQLFPDWYLGRHRGAEPDTAMLGTLEQSFATIVAENLGWPSVYVHRDFMPRNLMMPNGVDANGQLDPRLGVLDFQDAVYGPITYDIASLMRDAFVSWEEDFVLDVTIRYWEQARRAGLPVGNDFGAFYRGVEWMGLQRHLKVAGIFARLTLRDGKPQYLADTPRFIAYLRATAGRYRELRPLLRLLDGVEGTTDVSGFAFGRV